VIRVNDTVTVDKLRRLVSELKTLTFLCPGKMASS